MKNWKFWIGLTCFLGLVALRMRMATHFYNNPPEWLVEIQQMPVSWVDTILGFVYGSTFAIAVLLMLYLRRSIRECDHNGGGNGTRRSIKMPFVGKVISIEDLRRMPPKGPVQMAPTGS